MATYSREVEIKGKSAQELYDKVSADIEKFLAKSSLGGAEIDRDESRKEVRVKSSMFSATLACLEGKIRFDAKLGLIASAFRGKLDEGINKWLAKTFSL
jgi:hypothetical protein